jgi:hypothetical protein
MGKFPHTYFSLHVQMGSLHEYIPYQNPQYSQMALVSYFLLRMLMISLQYQTYFYLIWVNGLLQ